MLLEETHRPEMHLAVISTLAVRGRGARCLLLCIAEILLGSTQEGAMAVHAFHA